MYFRQRAAQAREMAQSGDDLRLSRMLLDVADDLDAEADAIDASSKTERRNLPRIRPAEAYQALLFRADRESDAQEVQIVNLSAGGAKFRVDSAPIPGSRVVLEVPGRSVRLHGTIVRQRGVEAAMVFDSASNGDPGLGRLLLAEGEGDRIGA